MLARAALFLGLAWTCSLLGCDSHVPECWRYSTLDQACLGLSQLSGDDGPIENEQDCADACSNNQGTLRQWWPGRCLDLSRFDLRRERGGGAICNCDIGGSKEVICRDALYDSLADRANKTG